ncbi:MAG TPA: thiolase family protein [Elusimicrobiota bacterium]|jgi:acetyl-CoA acetyltransferase family protein|nr:thiolase family protein [Elusimicrobiota bacterium]
MSDTLILAGARTPFAAWSHGVTGSGAPGGAFKDLDPFDLGAAALKGALARAALAPDKLEHAVFGNMYQSGPHGCYGARYVTHRAGCPPETTGVAVSLACGTGLIALKTASDAVALGEAALVAAVGADAPSRLRRDVFVPSFTDISCGLHIAKTAEALAAEKKVSREALDGWARRSHLKAREAAAALAEEIVPAGGLDRDDAVLADPAPERFASARLLFADGSTLMTHANVHGVVDGGAALILSSARAAPGRALGRLVSTALVGVPPKSMAYAAVPAVRRALERARWRAADVDLWEINETFAAQVLLDSAELGLDLERVNVRGGAIALGHPFGATGLRLVLSLLLELRRRGERRGCAAISVGGGLGVAACVEAL